MINLRRLFLPVCCGLAVLGLAGGAAAAGTTNIDMTKIDAVAVSTLIKTASVTIRVIAYALSVGTIIYAGVLYFASGSQPENSGTAKTALKAVLTGLAIIVLAELIVRTTLGFVTTGDNQQGIDQVLHNNSTTP